jgi:hypothetical protein
MSEQHQAAETLRRQYGDDAGVIALLRAAEYAALGDAEASGFWEGVAICLAEEEGGSSGTAPH